MSATDSHIAANRFGVGARPDELAAIAADPKGWLRGQIAKSTPIPKELSALAPTAESLGMHFRFVRSKDPDAKKNYRKNLLRLMTQSLHARGLATIRSDAPFRERLVRFWSNHFAVSFATRPIIGAFAANYETEAIRPHVFGKFSDMLVASARHPAMLMYLDNFISVGPHSLGGKRTHLGLNENLAREILELHTLGVKGGYTQADVIAFAKILTGWSIRGVAPHENDGFGQIYRRFAHEPGAKILLGRTYDEAGEDEGIAALNDLARHPSTARFIATKLARHFVADDPPESAIHRLERKFRDSDGDLGEIAGSLIDLDEAWRDPFAKMKSPDDLVISALRALGANDVPTRGLLGSYRELGQFPFSAPSPAGWPDRAADWISPEALMRRIEWARALAARLPRTVKPETVFARTVAAVASEETRLAVGAAPSGEDALALIFASPEFQRR